MTASLTPRMAQALSFIRSYAAEKGIVPTYREIGLHLELKSKSSVHRLVHALEARGAIHKNQGGKARCIMIDEPDAIAVAIPRDLYRYYDAIAKREKGSAQSVIRDVLRANAGDC